MEENYTYQMKPLVMPGLTFLLLYPVLIGLIYKLANFPPLELRVLSGIYVFAGLGILSLWIYAKSKYVRVEDEQMVIHSVLGNRVLRPGDIRRVTFYWDDKGREIAQIRTRQQTIYLNEFYFPFPELMSDLEVFIRDHGIRSNVNAHHSCEE